MSDSPLVRFYAGDGTDYRRRTLAHIWGYNHDKMEEIHDFIQWLFPLREPSEFNRYAPLVTDADVAAFRERPALIDALRQSFEWFLDFLGLAWDGLAVVDADGPVAEYRRRLAFEEPNHNWLRITRILLSLNLLGLEPEARAFFNYLHNAYQQGVGITPETFAYWRDAVRAAG